MEPQDLNFSSPLQDFSNSLAWQCSSFFPQHQREAWAEAIARCVQTGVPFLHGIIMTRALKKSYNRLAPALNLPHLSNNQLRSAGFLLAGAIASVTYTRLKSVPALPSKAIHNSVPNSAQAQLTDDLNPDTWWRE